MQRPRRRAHRGARACRFGHALRPDGRDPVDGTHGAAPVPALRWGAGIAGPARMTEAAVADAPIRPPSWPLRSAALVEAAA